MWPKSGEISFTGFLRHGVHKVFGTHRHTHRQTDPKTKVSAGGYKKSKTLQIVITEQLGVVVVYVPSGWQCDCRRCCRGRYKTTSGLWCTERRRLDHVCRNRRRRVMASPCCKTDRLRRPQMSTRQLLALLTARRGQARWSARLSRPPAVIPNTDHAIWPCHLSVLIFQYWWTVSTKSIKYLA